MTEPNQAVVDKAVHEGESMGARDLVELIERYEEGPGVDPETVEAYAAALEARDDYAFDAEDFLAHVDANTTDADWWEGGVYYEIGDGVDDRRISLFPRAWHERLGGSTDVREYVAFILDEDPDYLDDLALGGPGGGVPEKAVVEALMLVGRVDRPEANTLINEARERGDVVEDADQNPDADVYLPERRSDDMS
ncbi:hypothetical protein [Halosimplex amylolyticum]|uniref:hypothetical protein n=1 Tax=Halosimplex amylolyticum TaxID=3396616 RepID=UPI003F570A2D